MQLVLTEEIPTGYGRHQQTGMAMIAVRVLEFLLIKKPITRVLEIHLHTTT